MTEALRAQQRTEWPRNRCEVDPRSGRPSVGRRVFALDDHGVETRAAPTTELNGQDRNGSVIRRLHRICLCPCADGISVAFYQYESSEQLPSLDSDRRQLRTEAGAMALDDVGKEARGAGVARRSDCAAMRRRDWTPGRRWPICRTKTLARIRRPLPVVHDPVRQMLEAANHSPPPAETAGLQRERTAPAATVVWLSRMANAA